MGNKMRDWPRGAKALAWGAFAILAFFVWSFLASFIFLAGLRMLDLEKSFPLLEFWKYAGYYGFSHPVAGFWLKVAATMATALPLVATIIAVLRNGLPKSGKSLHGETRWANFAERMRGGFYAKRGGIIVGRDENGKILSLDKGHLMVTAPTGSGKGVGFVIPNCLLFDGSIVVLDPKRENFDFTAGIRAAAGQKTFLFDPLSSTGQTHRYNPFDYVRRGQIEAYDDIQRIAQMIYPNISGDQAFWNDSSRSAFFGFAAYLMETPGRPFTIGEVYRLLARPASVPLVRAEIVRRREAGNPYSEVCVGALDDYLNNSEDLVNNIRKSATAKLSLWNNPRIDAATAESDFDFRDLRRSLQAIYVGVDPNQIEQVRPLLSLFFQQLIDVNTQQLPRKDATLKHDLLVLLDEFPILGAMPVIANAFAFVRGYNIRMATITQSHAQLRDKDLYGPDKAAAIRDNCAAELSFGMKGLKACEELSSELGYNTVLNTTRSGPRLFRILQPNRVNATQSDTKRALLLPQEIMRLRETQSIITKAGMYPIKGERIRWYEEEPFKSLQRDPPHVPTVEVTLRMDGGPVEATDSDDTGSFAPKPVVFPESEGGSVEDLHAETLAAEDEAIEPPMMPHRANGLLDSIMGAKVDLSGMGLEDGRAAVAAIIDRLPAEANASPKSTTTKQRSAAA